MQANTEPSPGNLKLITYNWFIRRQNMTTPATSEAYLKIEHSIAELLSVCHFSEHQRRILDLILRLSWACGKKTAYIPHQRDFEVIGVPENHIKAHIDWLVAAFVIV